MAKGSTNGKDPCVSWYWNDWGGGTRTLTRHLKGCYMDLLEAQFNNGGLTLDEVKTVLASDFGQAWPTLQKKFVIGEDGLYRNKRLYDETIKRKSYNQSRRNNLSSAEHMGNEIEIRKQKFKEEVFLFSTKYPDEMLTKFCNYWTEMNKTKTKMKFEKQETFEIHLRLATWAGNQKDFTGTKAEFPDRFDKKLYYELQSTDQAKFYRYQDHLRSLGFEPKYNTTDSPLKGSLTGWFKKHEQAA